MKWLFWMCVLLIAQLAVDSHQQHLADKSLLQNDFPYIDDTLQEFDVNPNNLTIREVVEMTEKNVTFPNIQSFANILRSQPHLLTDIPANSKVLKNLEIKVFDSITRTLRFYGSQLNEITEDNTALCLKILKDIDDKHGKVLQKTFPLDEWIQSNCDDSESDSSKAIFCRNMISQWKRRFSGKCKPNMEYWKPAFVLQNYLNQIDDKILENIGNEKEGLWGIPYSRCPAAVVINCENPYICERNYLDPTPRSQYLLTHQILQRLFIDNADCSNLRSFVTEDDMYTKLCTKAYMEAQYLDLLDVPINKRDLFVELVAVCGYLGYTNFLREDWLERILSWQSQSDFGCFLEEPHFSIGLPIWDISFKRRATKNELEQGVEPPNEMCLPHFTDASLIALTSYWHYLMDLKRFVDHPATVGAFPVQQCD